MTKLILIVLMVLCMFILKMKFFLQSLNSVEWFV
uniref:NADH dehydrogenase subunit 1 n=1 Tax=Heterorhabditis bacteriophora TaxID=37862 RepID=A0A1I7WTF7_HETBA